MNLDFIKQRKELVSIAMLALAGIMAVMVIVKLAAFFVETARAKSLVARANSQIFSDPNETKEFIAKYTKIAESLKNKNLYAPPESKTHPVKQVNGIIGDEAIINGKLYKVGDKIGDAELIAIEPTYVRIRWEGKEKKFAPLEATTAGGTNKKPGKKGRENADREAGPQRPSKARQQERGVEENDPLAWMGIKLSPAARAKQLEMWNNLSDEQKKKWKERWNSMSDEEKQKTIDQLEKNS